MKKQILSFLFVLGLGLFMANSAFADNETQVSVGASVTYSFTTGNGDWTGSTTPVYTWVILSGSTGDTPAPVANYTSPLASAISNPITWNIAGTYRIQIVAKDANGCISDPFYKTITVTEAELCIASADGTVGTTTVSAPTGTTTCSLIATNSSGNGVGGGSDQTEFYATITGATANRDYTVVYSVNGVNSATTATIRTDAFGAGAVKITVNTTAWAGAFTNDTNSPSTTTIAVVSMSDGTWTGTKLCASFSYPVTVRPTPTINF